MSRTSQHPLVTRLSGAALGRLVGKDRAASMLGVDRNTVARWMGEHPADDDWAIIEKMAGAQLMLRLASGKVTSPRDLATVKGIAGRNLRVKELLARREARKDAEEPEAEPNPVREQLDRLDDRRMRLFRVQLQIEIRERAYDRPDKPIDEPSSEGDYVASITQAVDELLALPDDEIDAEYERLTARRDEVTDELFTRAEALLAPEAEAGSMPVAPERPQEPVGQRRTPDRPSGRVRAPEAMVIDIGSRADHDRAWQPLERRERP